jgi:hypothetical protein
MSTAFEIRCCNHDCLLAKGIQVPDVATAELTAFAHESRWRDELDTPHVVSVDLVATSNPATGRKEDAHG